MTDPRRRLSPPHLAAARPSGFWLLVLLMAGAGAVTAAAYWPGLMTWDSVRQYGQALDGAYDDWHPPAMDWLWRQLTLIHDGPAPMLLLQLAFYWTGFALLAGRAWRLGRPGLAAALASVGLLPLGIALMGAVLKDCLLAGLLVTATGLLTWSRDMGTPRRGAAAGLAAVLLLAGATLRFNAFLACVPLGVALLPSRWRGNRWRLALAVVAATALFLLPLPIADRMLGAERSGVELSLVIFDLGGITRESGVDAFPPLGVAQPVEANRACYSPVKWDPYSNWVDPVCPLGFDAVRAWLVRSHESATRLWLTAILSHPLAYAAHRARHFNVATRFLVHDPVERAVQVESAPNPWRYSVKPTPLLHLIDTLASRSADAPFGWPIAGIALALGALLVAPRLPSSGLIVPIALSALLYGSGYAVFGVAAELRYHLWTMIAALIAAVLAAGDIARRPAARAQTIAIAAAPLIAILVPAIGFRLIS